MILIDHIYIIYINIYNIYKGIYCKHLAYMIEGWVGKFEVCRLAGGGSGRSVVHRQNFFFLQGNFCSVLNAFQLIGWGPPYHPE